MFMNHSITHIEELSLNAFPALQTEVYDGWILRFSDGYTHRANCIWPLYESSIDLETKIKHCEKKYTEKNLPTIFKISDENNMDLDFILNASGYQLVKNVQLMACNLSQLPLWPVENIHITKGMNESWLDAYIDFNGTQTKKVHDIAARILQNVSSNMFCAELRQDNQIMGFGRVVLDQEIIALYSLHINEKFRRQGLGIQLCKALMNIGIEHGAGIACLQVASDNKNAISLYEKLGFQSMYHYWFREKRTANSKEIID